MRRLAEALLILLLFDSVARADGVVIPSRAVAEPVRTPDQRALVAFDGSTETLVVETTFEGAGRDFAWIVPLPAKPVVEESTTGLFPTLEVLSAPRVVDRSKGSLGWTGPAALGVLLFAAFVGSRRFAGATAVGVSLFIAVPFVLLTSISCSGESAATAGTTAVRELSRERVGAFDVAVVDPGDGSGLRTWLDERGFTAPAAVDAVAVDCARRGWVFVAAKLTAEEEPGEVRRVHPLAFRFPAREPVYPMRLTLAANPSCALELFAFGPGTAECDGMTAAYSHDLPDSGERRHAEVAKRGGGARLTKLTGTFDAATLQGDLLLRWVPPRDVEPELWTFAAAADRANTAGAWTALVVGLLASVVVGSWRRTGPRPPLAWRLLAYGAAAALAGGVIPVVFFTTPRLPHDARRVAEFGLQEVSRDVARAMPPQFKSDVAAARAWISGWASAREMREEDSPGNYTLRQVDGRVELVVYDGLGRETVTDLTNAR